MGNLIKRTLIEIRNDVVALNQSNHVTMKLFDKHDLVFFGNRLNKIYVVELFYKLNLSIDDYIDIIPSICDELQMRYLDVVTSQDLDDPDLDIRRFIIELI